MNKFDKNGNLRVRIFALRLGFLASLRLPLFVSVYEVDQVRVFLRLPDELELQ